MKRMALLKVSVPLNIIFFFLQAGSGITRIFVNNDLLTNVHLINGLLLAALVLVHLGLNWSWIKMNYLQKKPAP